MTTRKPVVGIVGGIGSGKSAVAASFARHGGAVINADKLGHAALEDPANKERVVARWGTDVLDESGAVSRKKLGAVVFADDAEREALEAIVHPWIAGRIREAIAAAQADPAVQFILLDAAIMIEAGWSEVCDRLIFVEVPRAVRLARLQASRGWTAADLDARERAQLPLGEKAARADWVVRNDGTLADLDRRVDEVIGAMGLI